MRLPSVARSFPTVGSAVAAALLAVAVASFITFSSGADTELIAWGSALGVALLTRFTLTKRTIVGVVMIYAYLALGVGAALLYHPAAHDYYGANPGIAFLSAATPGYRYLNLFTVIAASLWLAFFLCASKSESEQSANRGLGLGLGSLPVITLPAAALGLAVVPLFLDWYGTGFHTVLHASIYLERTGPAVAFKIGRALGAIGLFIAGYVMFADRSIRMRVLAALIALGYAALYLGTETRFFGLVVPMLYLGGLLSGRWTTRQRTFGLVITAVMALYMIQIPLALRIQPEHGLVPALTLLRQNPSILFADPINDILFGAPLSLYVAHEVPALPWHYMVSSLSPLPSSMTDWSTIAPALQLNAYTPYSALGELLNHGWVVLFVVMGALGSVYALLERLVRSSAASGLGVLILSSVAALAVLRSTEYNLRTFARLAYYVAAVTIVVVLVPTLLARRRERKRRAVTRAGFAVRSAH
jgi:hypothetical protein